MPTDVNHFSLYLRIFDASLSSKLILLLSTEIYIFFVWVHASISSSEAHSGSTGLH